MKVAIPQNNSVLCKKDTSDEHVTSTGFTYKSNDIPLYRVVSISKSLKKNDLDLKVGDLIRANSNGTSLTIDDVDYVIFNIENIMGKVI